MEETGLTFDPKKAAAIDESKLQTFWIVLNILGKGGIAQGFPFPFRGHSMEEAAHYALFILCTQWPNVTGYDIRSADQKTILESVNAGVLMAKLMKPLQEVLGMQPFRTAVPVAEATAKGHNLQALYEEAKKEGKLIVP
jgi:hypothetical protein